MSNLRTTKSYNWQDVNLLAKQGTVHSRSEIPIEGKRIVVSAMTSIIGPTFINAVAKLPVELRPTLHIPRDIFKKKNLDYCHELGLTDVFVGVGLKPDYEYEAYAVSLGYTTAFIDIANGYHPGIPDRVEELKTLLSFQKVICGSVHTQEGYTTLSDAGVDIVRSGIAPGSVCITKDSTGFTRGTFTEIYDMNSISGFYPDTELLADGGIKSPSDCVKAFLAGADYIMTGRLFVTAGECRMHQKKELEAWFLPSINEIPSGPNVQAKHIVFPEHVYFGMASDYGKMALGLDVKNVEGTSDFVVPTTTLLDILTKTWDGIRSGVSYSGYSTLTAAIGNGDFEAKF